MTSNNSSNINALLAHARAFIYDCVETSTNKERTIRLIHEVLTHVRYAINDDNVYQPFSERMIDKIRELYRIHSSSN